MVNMIRSVEVNYSDMLTSYLEMGAYSWTEKIISERIEELWQFADSLDMKSRRDNEGAFPFSTEQEQKIMSELGLLRMFRFLLQKYPILRIDSVLEPLITDTTLSKNSLRKFQMPYPAFFLDKIFKVENGFIMGVALFDEIALMTQANNDSTNGQPFSSRYIENIKIRNKEWEEIEGNNHKSIRLSYFHMSNDLLSFASVDVTRVFKPPKELHVAESKGLCITFSELSQQTLKFVLNVSNLIVNHVDIKNPTNSKRDIRVIPYYPDEKRRERKHDNHMSTIRVFGDLKEYTRSYNKERRKYNKMNIDAVLVRGYYRYLGSERYKNKRGETIWVAPFIRGMDKEFYQRIINVAP